MDVKAMVKNQNTIYNILKKSYSMGRLSHAYLFYGDEGTGKKEMAYALACMLYCENGGCLECDTCKAILENNHMNVDYIGIADKKTVISKEQITELQEEFSKTSLVDGTRIYIVDGIDTASQAAQNSLLKFIEDPLNTTPTIGIFIARDLSQVVPTILSRCALTHFKAIPMDKTIEVLKENGVKELDSILCAALTNNISEAIEFSKDDKYIELRDLFLEFISINKSKDGVIYYLNNFDFMSEGNNLEIFLKWLILFLQDCLFTTSDDLILKPIYDKIKAYNSRCSNDLKARLSDVLAIASKLKYNVTAKNAFHELVMKLL